MHPYLACVEHFYHCRALLQTCRVVWGLRSLPAPLRSGEGSVRPGKALFLRRSTRGSESSTSQKAAAQGQCSQPRAGQGQAAELPQEALPHSASPGQPAKHRGDIHEKQRRHTEGSQPPPAPADGSTQGYGRSSSLSAGSREAMQSEEPHSQSTGGTLRSFSRMPSRSESNRSRSASANDDGLRSAQILCATACCSCSG